MSNYWHQMYRRPTATVRVEVENGEQRFEALLSKELSLADRNFMTSLQQQHEKKGKLSEKQVECLVKCESRYSADAIAERATWGKEYLANHRGTMLICAKYYATTTYFSDLAARVLATEDFVPTKRQFEAMTANKYAKKALATATNPPAFPVGSLARLRNSQAIPYNVTAHRGEPVLVVANYATGIHPSSDIVVGGKTIRVEDRWLKSMNAVRKTKGKNND